MVQSNYEYQDQMSILYHEAYHCNHDEAWSSETKMTLDSPYYLNMLWKQETLYDYSLKHYKH